MAFIRPGSAWLKFYYYAIAYESSDDGYLLSLVISKKINFNLSHRGIKERGSPNPQKLTVNFTFAYKSET